MHYAISAEDVYRLFVIKTDKSKWWVVDKRGPSVVASDRFSSYAEAAEAWSRLVQSELSR